MARKRFCFFLVGTKCVYWVWKGLKNAVFPTLTQFRVLNKNYESSEEMVADMYSRICTKISFLHVLSTLRALLSTLWASVLWELSKKHQKIDENWWKFVKNLLSWNMFLIMLDAFWIQKNMFKVQKNIPCYWIVLQRVQLLLHVSLSKRQKIEKCKKMLFLWKTMKIHQNTASKNRSNFWLLMCLNRASFVSQRWF